MANHYQEANTLIVQSTFILGEHFFASNPSGDYYFSEVYNSSVEIIWKEKAEANKGKSELFEKVT